MSLRNSPLAHTVLSLQPWGQPRLLRSLKDNIYYVSSSVGQYRAGGHMLEL